MFYLYVSINKFSKTMHDIVTQNFPAYLDIWENNTAYNLKDQKVYHLWKT